MQCARPGIWTPGLVESVAVCLTSGPLTDIISVFFCSILSRYGCLSFGVLNGTENFPYKIKLFHLIFPFFSQNQLIQFYIISIKVVMSLDTCLIFLPMFIIIKCLKIFGTFTSTRDSSFGRVSLDTDWLFYSNGYTGGPEPFEGFHSPFTLVWALHLTTTSNRKLVSVLK